MAKTNYDSQFCGSLPLSHINQIQAYGYLIITDPQLNIVQVSDNQHEFLGMEPQQLFGNSLLQFIAENSTEQFKTAVAQGKERIASPVMLKDHTGEIRQYLALIHHKPGYIIFEFERTGGNQKSFAEIYQMVREAAATIQQIKNLQEALTVAAEELKNISGFDKVMIYKFDEDWNGLVLAEAMEPGMESYLHLHFPASDIPRQARELYLKNPYRQIPDRVFQPVRLLPVINPIISSFVDLSDCNLRSVTKVHLEYLKNMNVMASMSTRIIKDNRLWGLISCHHRQARFLSYQECCVLELLSDIISSKLTSTEIRENSEQLNEQQKVLSTITEGIFSERSLAAAVKNTGEKILELLHCTGVIYVNNSKIVANGACPPDEMTEKLVIWLQTRSLRGIFHTNSLIGWFDEAAGITSVASGLIALPVVPEKGEFLLVFREELPHAISWGGNPAEAIQFEADKNTYHPRNSFAQWQEEIRNTSEAFTDNELFFAGELHRVLLGYKIREINQY